MTAPGSPQVGRARDQDQFARRPHRRSWDRIGMIAGAGSIVSLLFVSAVSISHDAQVGHQVLTERFQSRAVLTASFVSGNVEDLAKREQVQAARRCLSPT